MVQGVLGTVPVTKQATSFDSCKALLMPLLRSPSKNILSRQRYSLVEPSIAVVRSISICLVLYTVLTKFTCGDQPRHKTLGASQERTGSQ